jgi:hypothetical protein
MAKVIREAIDAHLRAQCPKPGQEWFWSELWQVAEHEAKSDPAENRTEHCASDADFFASLE